jgi:hypothetical protein
LRADVVPNLEHVHARLGKAPGLETADRGDAVEEALGERRVKYCKDRPDKTCFLNQHSNPNNGLAHEMTTGAELWEQTGGKLGAVVIGLGTGGTFDGLSRYLYAEMIERDREARNRLLQEIIQKYPKEIYTFKTPTALDQELGFSLMN